MVSNDEKIEAIDFIVNVLKEHEKDLDRLITRLEKALDQKAHAPRKETMESRLSRIQREVDRLAEGVTD